MRGLLLLVPWYCGTTCVHCIAPQAPPAEQRLADKIGSLEKLLSTRERQANSSMWREAIDESSGNVYYWDPATNDSRWELPPGAVAWRARLETQAGVGEPPAEQKADTPADSKVETQSNATDTSQGSEQQAMQNKREAAQMVSQAKSGYLSGSTQQQETQQQETQQQETVPLKAELDEDEDRLQRLRQAARNRTMHNKRQAVQAVSQAKTGYLSASKAFWDPKSDSRPCLKLTPMYGLTNRMEAVLSALVLAETQDNFQLAINWVPKEEIGYAKLADIFPSQNLNEKCSQEFFACSCEQKQCGEACNKVSQCGLELSRSSGDAYQWIEYNPPQPSKHASNAWLWGQSAKPAAGAGISTCHFFKHKHLSDLDFGARAYKKYETLFVSESYGNDNVAKVKQAMSMHTTVGVHVRMGDTFDMKSKRLEQWNSKFNDFAKKVDHMFSMVNKDKRLVFLSTDTAHVQEAFRKKYGDRVVWLNDIKGDKTTRSTKTDIQEALLNIHLLSQCELFVGTTNSTFSEFSRMMMTQRVVLARKNTEMKKRAQARHTASKRQDATIAQKQTNSGKNAKTERNQNAKSLAEKSLELEDSFAGVSTEAGNGWEEETMSASELEQIYNGVIAERISSVDIEYEEEQIDGPMHWREF